TAPMPPELDEMLFAGFLRNKNVEMVKCRTIDQEVPADADIVLEGYVDPSESRLEGPFGDHTGYYSPADQYPVFHLTCLTHRKDAIYPATIVGKPPMEDCYIGKTTERLFLPLIKLVVPEIVDMDLPIFGVFHNYAFVSIDKRYPFQARKVMHAIWGLGQLMFTKIVVVVDKGVNVHDVNEVMWKVGNNVDPRRDVAFVDGPLDVLDHASPLPRAGSKMGIDATKKWPEEGHPREWPDEIEMSPDVKKLVDGRWREYGFGA
ncbi:MAG: UbiD family decarboxylase, partial [Planctomycetes bacterium]|nr:UbiD family decarboxylase [Planctomycetota bacterium]